MYRKADLLTRFADFFLSKGDILAFTKLNIMNMHGNLLGGLTINKKSSSPKYQQLADGILNAIKLGKIDGNEVLPSINELSFMLEISRDTAEKGYRNLRAQGIIKSIPGKGYFVVNNTCSRELKICLLFNTLSVQKNIIYNAFVKAIGKKGSTDLFIYNNDIDTLEAMILAKRNEYSHFVLIPHFNSDEHQFLKVLKMIPREKLLIMDRLIPGMDQACASVCQDFEKDLYGALKNALGLLKKYSRLNIVFPANGYFPREILWGFSRFCKEYGFEFTMISHIEKSVVRKGEVYIALMEDDFVVLVEKILQANLSVGKDVGVISYNDTPMKRIMFDGITTVSTDFVKLGQESAVMILDDRKEAIKVPFYFTPRHSL